MHAPQPGAPPATASLPGARRPGGYYLDDGPDAQLPDIDFMQVPDAVPELLPLASGANRPYEALGEVYFPDTSNLPFSERGLATWYGRRFHGRRTASGEPYDMYAMTAAHKTLPIPSYARVTDVASGRSVVVRINDRGPFAPGRVIDLSYTAATKLGLVRRGSGQVVVERAFPGEPAAVPPAPAVEAAPVAAAPLASAAMANASGGTGNTGLALQLGAFRDADNAQRLLQRAQSLLPEHAAALQVVLEDGLHRVRLGPLADADTRSEVAQRVSARLGVKPRLLGP